MNNIIDTTINFADDTPKFWEGFWENRGGLGTFNDDRDPDTCSVILKKYHTLLWSKEIPDSDEVFNFEEDFYYLASGEHRVSSDGLVNGFRHFAIKHVLDELKIKYGEKYQAWQEEYIKKTYTIGGMILFPRNKSHSINPRRGNHENIKDRFDITIDCIRKYYAEKNNKTVNFGAYPLKEDLIACCSFFDLFGSFKNYVDFFFLNPIVSSDYKKVNLILGDGSDGHPRPKNVDEYLLWREKSIEFIDARNNLIDEWCKKHLA